MIKYSSNNWVYFDDFKVTQTKTNVLQYNEYYAYGLQTANSWTRENATGNNFLHNGGTELNTTTGVYDLEYRNYDPVLARMTQVDPMASKYASLTPYNYSFNSPTNFNDPLGDDPPQRNTPLPTDAYFDHGVGWSAFSGGGRIGPGSGRHWSDGFRSVGDNAMLMSQNAFNNFYGLTGQYGADESRRQQLAQQAGTKAYLVTTDLGNFIYADRSFEGISGWYRAQAFSAGQDFGSSSFGFTGVPSSEHSNKFGISEVGLTHTLLSAWYEKNAYLIKHLTGAVPKVVTTFGKGLGVLGVVISVSDSRNNYNKNGLTSNTVIKGVMGIGLGVAGTVAAFTSPVWGTAVAIGGIAYGALDYFGVVDNVINGTKSFWSDVKNQTIRGFNSFNNIGIPQ